MKAEADYLIQLWSVPGVSEFCAALIGALVGGGMTLLAQQLAIMHDRQKESARRLQAQAAVAWSIYFKISEVFEALTHLNSDIEEARQVADEAGRELWQIFQCPPHDPRIVTWNAEELVFLIEKNQFDLMERYREATSWLSNIVQGMKTYREMRLDFLLHTPSNVNGTTGSIVVDEQNRATVMPRVAHLRSLSESMFDVVHKQQPDVRKLLQDYAAAMKIMIGRTPNLVFADEAAPKGKEEIPARN